MNLQTARVVTALNVENSLVFTGVCNYFELTGVVNIGPSNGVVEIYYPETNQWEYSVTNLNPARVLYAPISYGNKAYYAGGGISAMTDKISILEYHPIQTIHVPGDFNQPYRQQSIMPKMVILFW